MPHDIAVFSDLITCSISGSPLRIALADNLLAEPFGRETRIQHMQILYNVLAALDDRILRRNSSVGTNTELERGEERVRDFVGGEGDVGVLE